MHNGNRARAWIGIASPIGNNDLAIEVFPVRAGRTRWVPVHTRYALWFGVIGQGGNAGYGKLRGVPLTKRDARSDKSRASDLNTLFTFDFGRTRARVADAVSRSIATAN